MNQSFSALKMTGSLLRSSVFCLQLFFVACGPNQSDVGDSTQLKTIQETKVSPITAIRDSVSAASEAARLGYLAGSSCGSEFKAGQELMFSASHDARYESGQASGLIVEDGGGTSFKQLAELNTQGQDYAYVARAPGVLVAGRAMGDGMLSTWDLRDLAKTLCDVSFARTGIAVFDKVDAAIVDLTAETAGLDLEEPEVLRLALTQSRQDGNTAELQIYFKKNFGVTAFKYEQTDKLATISDSRRNLTLQWFLNSAGGDGKGDRRTLSEFEKAMTDETSTSVAEFHDACRKAGFMPDGAIETSRSSVCYERRPELSKQQCEDMAGSWFDEQYGEKVPACFTRAKVYYSK